MVWEKILQKARDDADGRTVMPSDVAIASEAINRDSGNRDTETARWFALLDALDFMFNADRLERGSEGNGNG